MAQDKSKRQAKEERKMRKQIKLRQLSPDEQYQAQYDRIVRGLNKPERAGIKWKNRYTAADLEVFQSFRSLFRGKKQNPPDLICDMPPFYFDFFESDDFDGYADVARKREEGFIYSVSTGLLEKSHQYMIRAFSSPNCLVNMDSRDEISREEGTRMYYPRKIVTAFAEPVSIPRRFTAFYLASIMVKFAVTHEYRHIQAGHLLYARNHKPSKLINQALELECDTYAVRMVLRAARELFKDSQEKPPSSFNHGQLTLWIARKYAIPNMKTAYHFVLSAVYMVFRILESSEKATDDWEQDDHPPAQVRLLHCMIYSQEIDSDDNRDTDTLFKYIVTLGEQICRINGIRDRMEYPVMNERMLEYVLRLNDIRSSVIPSLQKYAFVKLD